MIAYNTQWLHNLQVREQADKAQSKHCISKAEQEQVYAAYPVGFYTPNIFVRIGLFILTWVILIFGMSLLSLAFFSAVDSEEAVGVLIVFFGLLSYFGLEMMVKNKHYRSGVDDGLLWMSACCIIGGLNVAIPHLPALANAILIFVIALFLFIRFTNMLMAGVAALALLAVVFLTMIKLGDFVKAIVPFVMMLSATGLYFFVQRQLKSGKWIFYINGLLLTTVLALVSVYVAGNYFVVREASISMFNLALKEGENIPLSWLFWIFTVFIPVFYIVRGIQKKDAVLLRVGLLLIAAVVLTVRNYYHVLPAEIAMCIGGLVFIVIAYGLISYLKEPRHGFTHKDLDDAFFMDKLHIESLVIAQTFGTSKQATDTGTQFGGGTGGGGGASGEY